MGSAKDRIGLAAMNWNTVLCLSMMFLVAFAICVWATYELNGGGVVENRAQLDEVFGALTETVVQRASSEAVQPYSIFESKPVLSLKSHTISDYDAAIEMGRLQALPQESRLRTRGTSRIPRDHNNRFGTGNPFVDVSTRPATTNRRAAFVGPSNTNNTFPNVDSYDQDRARDRRVLLGLKGVNNG